MFGIAPVGLVPKQPPWTHPRPVTHGLDRHRL